MELIYGTDQDFESLTKEGYVLVDFFANWCGPCKMLGPVLEEIASDRSDVQIIKIDIDENEETPRKFGVMSIPTLVLMKDGKEVAKQVGLLSRSDLVNWIEDHKN